MVSSLARMANSADRTDAAAAKVLVPNLLSNTYSKQGKIRVKNGNTAYQIFVIHLQAMFCMLCLFEY
jgi:hypothetical protein